MLLNASIVWIRTKVKNNFSVKITRFANLLEISGAWSDHDFSALLDIMEVEDHSDLTGSDLRELCVMSLQDLKPEQAAEIILRHRMSDVLSEGKIKNISVEMLDEKMWEEYADYALHERFFSVGTLLYEAFPKGVSKPDAVEIDLEITANNDQSAHTLKSHLNESFLVRLLAEGMESNSVLHRMFDDNLGGSSFPDAEKIIWIVNSQAISEKSWKVEVISSGYWLDSLHETRAYESSAFADK